MHATAEDCIDSHLFRQSRRGLKNTECDHSRVAPASQSFPRTSPTKGAIHTHFIHWPSAIHNTSSRLPLPQPSILVSEAAARVETRLVDSVVLEHSRAPSKVDNSASTTLLNPAILLTRLFPPPLSDKSLCDTNHLLFYRDTQKNKIIQYPKCPIFPFSSRRRTLASTRSQRVCK